MFENCGDDDDEYGRERIWDWAMRFSGMDAVMFAGSLIVADFLKLVFTVKVSIYPELVPMPSIFFCRS